LTTADAVDDKPGDGSEDRINDHVHATQQEGEIGGRANGTLEQDGEVVDNSITAAKLLEELGRATEEYAAEVLGLATSKELAKANSLSVRPGGGRDTVQDDSLLEMDFFV
jgi:hypothetical protein